MGTRVSTKALTEKLMSDRYNPKKLVRDRTERIRHGADPMPTFKPEPRAQTVWRDGKPVTLAPMLCRLHNEPWQTCALCSKAKR
jgi:hypothetical protein